MFSTWSSKYLITIGASREMGRVECESRELLPMGTNYELLSGPEEELVPDVDVEAEVVASDRVAFVEGANETLGSCTGEPSNSAHPPRSPISTTRSSILASSSFLPEVIVSVQNA